VLGLIVLRLLFSMAAWLFSPITRLFGK